MVSILDHPQGLKNHPAERGAGCYLHKGFVEKALNPEEEVWIPQPGAVSNFKRKVRLPSEVNTTLRQDKPIPKQDKPNPKQDKPNPQQTLPWPQINQCGALKMVILAGSSMQGSLKGPPRVPLPGLSWRGMKEQQRSCCSKFPSLCWEGRAALPRCESANPAACAGP